MIRKVWLLQPLAFARVGSSQVPSQSFHWGGKDLRPAGSGRNILMPGQSLGVAKNGSIEPGPQETETVRFKDGSQIRPVCPFFELHGEWEGGSGAITACLLKENGYTVRWRVQHANLKPFHLTNAPGDRIEAELPLEPRDFAPHPLLGKSRKGQGEPLVPPDRAIPMGRLQQIRPTKDFPEIRLRFYPPAGKVYGPEDLQERIASLVALPVEAPGIEIPHPLQQFFSNDEWKGFALPTKSCILNPKAAWPAYGLVIRKQLLSRLSALVPQIKQVLAHAIPGERSELVRMLLGPLANVGSLPPGMFAFASTLLAPKDPAAAALSLGLVDDLGDGIITCEIAKAGAAPLVARARVVVCPPHFAPDRRHPVSIADGLKDREDRTQAPKGCIFPRDAASQTVQELFERALETAGLSNLDVWNEYFRQENAAKASQAQSPIGPREAQEKLWRQDLLPSASPLPLTSLARRWHRRLASVEMLEDLFRDQPGALDRYVRKPKTPGKLYDRRMPGLMRGADRQPLHLTERQYEILKGWAERLTSPE